MSVKPKLFVLLAILLVCWGCAVSQYSSPSLANQGILSLSNKNAYLGSNLFLARQAEISPVFYNFLRARGGPTAMELVDEGFSGPRLLLYYPKDREVYAAEIERQNGFDEWIVRGPFSIKRTDFTSLARMDAAMLGEPVFIIFGKEQRFRFDKPTVHVKPAVIPTPVPTAVATAKKTSTKKKTKPVATIIHAKGDEPPVITEFKPLNADQQAIQMSKGFAERADNGDVVHTVKSEAETLAAISKWYTSSADNAKEIGTLNGIEPEKTLEKGARVKVPMKLLKNLKTMPAGFQ